MPKHRFSHRTKYPTHEQLISPNPTTVIRIKLSSGSTRRSFKKFGRNRRRTKVLMCTDSKSNKLSPFDFKMDKGGFFHKNCSKLLELAATDDLAGFKHEIEERGCDIDEVSFWYGRSFGSKKMGFEERTPIMIACLYGSTDVLNYIIGTGKVDVNRACGSDGATALHCAAAGGSWSSVEVVKTLIGASADNNVVDVDGKKPGDLISSCIKFSSNSKKKMLEMLLNGISLEAGDQDENEGSKTPRAVKEGMEKKEYPIDISLPDINNGLYGTDEFRMYSFKVKPCSRAYSHDWTECPFVHPGENARRRDPRKYHYTCVPCPEFKKGSCAKGDSCEYAHGVFESWLHPAQYRTRLCKDETGCSRKVCFFAQTRRVTSVTRLPVRHAFSKVPCGMWQNKVNHTPPALQLPGSRLKTALSARDADVRYGVARIGQNPFATKAAVARRDG
ncbi:hypothetical protein DH2020_022333 [Rehmannia glutinosa]|uniref:C3H1-type domain-containing protein n=1 Tax=Rehmannia glutinosa TaxID=99300 RepID=A0ABR0WDF6_REHGL